MTEKEIAKYLLGINDLKRRIDLLMAKHEKLLSSDKISEIKDWFIDNYGKTIGPDLYQLLLYAGFHVDIKNFVDCKPGYIYYLWFDYDEDDEINARLGCEIINGFDFSDKICFILHNWPNMDYSISCYVEHEIEVIHVGPFNFYYFYSKTKRDLDDVKEIFKNYIGNIADEAIKAGRDENDFNGIEDVKYIIDTIEDYTYTDD